MEAKLDATSDVISEAKLEATNDVIMEAKLGINQESKNETLFDAISKEK